MTRRTVNRSAFWMLLSPVLLSTLAFPAAWHEEDTIGSSPWTEIAQNDDGAENAEGTALATNSGALVHAQTTGLVSSDPTNWPGAYTWVTARADGGMGYVVWWYDGGDVSSCPITIRDHYEHTCGFGAGSPGEYGDETNAGAMAWTHETQSSGPSQYVDPFYVWAPPPPAQGDPPQPWDDEGGYYYKYEEPCYTYECKEDWRRFATYSNPSRMDGDHTFWATSTTTHDQATTWWSVWDSELQQWIDYPAVDYWLGAAAMGHAEQHRTLASASTASSTYEQVTNNPG